MKTNITIKTIVFHLAYIAVKSVRIVKERILPLYKKSSKCLVLLVLLVISLLYAWNQKQKAIHTSTSITALEEAS
jgi:uncharacterized membrane protein